MANGILDVIQNILAGQWLTSVAQNPTGIAPPETPIKMIDRGISQPWSQTPTVPMQSPIDQPQDQSSQPVNLSDQISSMVSSPIFAALLGALAAKSMTPKNFSAFGPMVMGGMQTFGAMQKAKMEGERLEREKEKIRQEQQRIGLEGQRVAISGRTETRQEQKEKEERQLRERMLESYKRIHEAIMTDPNTDASLKQTAKMLDPTSPNYFNDLTKLHGLDINMKNATTRAEMENIRGHNVLLQQEIAVLKERLREGKEVRSEKRQDDRRRAVLQDDVAAARRQYTAYLRQEGVEEKNFPFESWFRQVFPGRYKEAVDEGLITKGGGAPVAPKTVPQGYVPKTGEEWKKFRGYD